MTPTERPLPEDESFLLDKVLLVDQANWSQLGFHIQNQS
jgi:hypothetical protein